MLLIKWKNYIVLELKKQFLQQFNRNIFFIDTKALTIIAATLPIAVILIAILMMAIFSNKKKTKNAPEKKDPLNPAFPHSETIVKYDDNKSKNTPLNNNYSNQQKTMNNDIQNDLSNTKNKQQQAEL